MTASPPDMLARTRLVLHHPFFPENVGSVARTMHNFGLRDFHVVAGVDPRHENAYKLAVASGYMLDAAVHHETFEPALAGCTLVLGTTSHPFPHMRVLTPAAAGRLARAHDGRVALVFGNEKNGLALEELRRCDAVIRIPALVPDASLNLAQAATVITYAWLEAALEDDQADPLAGWPALAVDQDLDALVAHMDEALVERKFYKPHNLTQRRAVLKRIVARLQLDQEELSLLRGLVSKLAQALDR